LTTWLWVKSALDTAVLYEPTAMPNANFYYRILVTP